MCLAFSWEKQTHGRFFQVKRWVLPSHCSHRPWLVAGVFHTGKVGWLTKVGGDTHYSDAVFNWKLTCMHRLCHCKYTICIALQKRYVMSLVGMVTTYTDTLVTLDLYRYSISTGCLSAITHNTWLSQLWILRSCSSSWVLILNYYGALHLSLCRINGKPGSEMWACGNAEVQKPKYGSMEKSSLLVSVPYWLTNVYVEAL